MFLPLSLRQRILWTLLPFAVLLAALGGIALWLLHGLGGSIDVILQENYESVVAMQNLKDSLERIDSSFQFMLVAQEMKEVPDREAIQAKARDAFATSWKHYDDSLQDEQANITIHPTEDSLVRQLLESSQQYQRLGNEFYDAASRNAATPNDYHGPGGLYDTFTRIKGLADEILQLNQQRMKLASDDASRLAAVSLAGLGAGFTAAICLAGLLVWQTMRTILRPIKAVQEAALGIAAGNLDQLVPVFSRDELGQLAEAFNQMAHHLREYRQSQTAHLMRAQRTSQAAIDSFPDPILVIDPDGRAEMANPEARRLFGVAPRSREHPAAELWQPPESLRQPLEDALHGQRDYLPEGFDRILAWGEAGRDRAYLPRILTIRDADGRTLGAAVVLQDVTRLRLLDQVKSDLVATASHELKTPLTSIRLAVHLLLEESVGPLTHKQTELLLDARENCERLLAMVNHLLDLARLERGSVQLDLQPIAPVTLLRDAVEAVRARADDKEIALTISVAADLPPVAADSQRMGHALRNLLDNAITYTDSGGTIQLSARRQDDSVILAVHDTGCGIAQEYLPRIFDKFFRVPGQSRGSGTGLGLAIVREVVAAHGGVIDCESQPNSGTTFQITLPVSHHMPESGVQPGGVLREQTVS